MPTLSDHASEEASMDDGDERGERDRDGGKDGVGGMEMMDNSTSTEGKQGREPLPLLSSPLFFSPTLARPVDLSALNEANEHAKEIRRVEADGNGGREGSMGRQGQVRLQAKQTWLSTHDGPPLAAMAALAALHAHAAVPGSFFSLGPSSQLGSSSFRAPARMKFALRWPSEASLTVGKCGRAAGRWRFKGA
ncbi:hypothetical protein TWF696_004389 [Orbilia brochopaga]|uniref:Uncharacterized protein n=1 Tax=Orbilia brochopaga TaxID=3140254 RepID=A0AAV9VCH4_9PEZI